MKQRIITGSIGGALFIILITLGGLWFTAALILLAAIAYREYLRMAKIALFSLTSLLGFVFLGIILASFFYALSKEDMLAWNNPSVFMALVYLLFIFLVLTKNKVDIEKAGSLLLGILYIGLGFGCFLQARLEQGLEVTFFVIILIWATDTGAYLVGRKRGKHKLWPSISPNKTIEGSLGGIIIAILAGIEI